MMAIAANEGFPIHVLNVTNAYLQEKSLEREINAELPKDLKQEGIICRLKMTVYGMFGGR